MQLVAYGAQDIYLTGNPQITFFKVVYRRHTNFAVESIEQTFNGAVDFDKRVTATISRNGDLVKQMYLEVDLPTCTGTGAAWTYGVGNALVKEVELEIGGQLIDRHYGEWMNIWTELSIPSGKRAGYDNMVLNHAKAGQLGDDTRNATTAVKRVYVPLQFWFCRNPGLALPLIALQYHEVKINLTTRPLNDLATVNTGETLAKTGSLGCKLYVDYVYLDTDERRRFAQVSHEYLIEQVQFTGDESVTASSSKNAVLNFNHPVKELIWVCRSSLHGTQDTDENNFGNNWFNFAGTTNGTTSEAFATAKLQLNGHDRFTERNADYFRKVQCFEHHTRVARVTGEQGIGTNNGEQYVHVYSFALSPEEHQPSGTCNFSRIDNAVLQLTNVTVAGALKVFAVNYNVLRIMSGMGGLAYSN
jgi:hypothetical protein